MASSGYKPCHWSNASVASEFANQVQQGVATYVDY